MRNIIIRILQALVIVAVASSLAQADDHQFMNFRKKQAAAGGLTRSDDFNRTNETPIAGNWTSAGYGINLNSNQVVPVNGDHGCNAHWSTDTFSNDQWSQVKLMGTDGRYQGPMVRKQAGTGNDGYILYVYGGTVWGFKRYDTFATLGAEQTKTIAAGAVVRIKAVGTTLSASFDGGSTWEAYTVTDSTYSGGYPGFWLTLNGTYLDDWAGGDQ